MENTDRGGGGRGEKGRRRSDKGNEGIKRSLPVFTKYYAAERRAEEGFLKQTDMLLPKTLSFIRIDAYISPSATGHAIIPVPSVVGEASTCRHAHVCVCMSVLMCVILRSTVSHPGIQTEATDQVM